MYFIYNNLIFPILNLTQFFVFKPIFQSFFFNYVLNEPWFLDTISKYLHRRKTENVSLKLSPFVNSHILTKSTQN